MTTPRLSIVLPIYNDERLMGRSVDSMLGPSFEDFELIVVDDGSTDGTPDLLDRYARKDSRVRVFRNPENRGVHFSLARALAVTRAEWIYGAASDDYILPGFFESGMGLLAEHPQAGLALGQTRCRHDSGDEAGTTPELWAERPCYISSAELAERITYDGVTGQSIWNRRAFDAAGGYHVSMRWHGDWFPLQVVAARHGVCFIPRPTAVFRLATNSYSSNLSSPLAQRDVLRTMLRTLLLPEFADIRGWFAQSRILTRFGPELARAAASLDDHTQELTELIAPYFWPHVANLLHEREGHVRLSVTRLLGQFGQDGLHHVPALEYLMNDRWASIAASARKSRRQILSATPLGRRMRWHIRRKISVYADYMERLLHPRLHRRLDQLEILLGRAVDGINGVGGGLGVVTQLIRETESKGKGRPAAAGATAPAEERKVA